MICMGHSHNRCCDAFHFEFHVQFDSVPKWQGKGRMNSKKYWRMCQYSSGSLIAPSLTWRLLHCNQWWQTKTPPFRFIYPTRKFFGHYWLSSACRDHSDRPKYLACNSRWHPICMFDLFHPLDQESNCAEIKTCNEHQSTACHQSEHCTVIERYDHGSNHKGCILKKHRKSFRDSNLENVCRNCNDGRCLAGRKYIKNRDRLCKKSSHVGKPHCRRYSKAYHTKAQLRFC